MYIGKLKIQSPEVPMSLSWKAFWDQPVTIKIILSEESFVDRVTFLFGTKTKLKELRLKNYAFHTAETGKYITSREITLQVGDTCKELYLTAQTDFSDFVLEGISVYGATFDGITLFPTAEKVEDLGRKFPTSNYQGFSSELSLKAEKVLREKWSWTRSAKRSQIPAKRMNVPGSFTIIATAPAIPAAMKSFLILWMRSLKCFVPRNTYIWGMMRFTRSAYVSVVVAKIRQIFWHMT